MAQEIEGARIQHFVINSMNCLLYTSGIPDVDAIGILTLTPGETAIIAGDMAVRSADVNVAFLDRFSGTLDVYKRQVYYELIRSTLDACNGNLSKAAEQLGVARSTLYRLSLIHI